MFAKRLIYVIAAVSLLAVGSQLAPSRASAQAGEIVAGTLFNTVEYAVTSDGRIYNRVALNPADPWGFMRAVPVTSPVVSIAVEFGAVPPNPVVIVFCSDGSVVECDGVAGSCIRT